MIIYSPSKQSMERLKTDTRDSLQEDGRKWMGTCDKMTNTGGNING
jgi:hypothetical protein